MPKAKPEGPKARRKARKFEPALIFKVYDLAKAGVSQTKIASACGVSLNTLDAWTQKYPEVAEALRRGYAAREQGSGVATFKEYVHRNIPSYLRPIWDEVVTVFEDADAGAHARLMALMENQGKRARQNLFVHAWVHADFDASEACRVMGVSKRTLDSWLASDPDFAELVDEVEWHKDNFYEGAFVRLVKAGDSAAVLHAVKSRLRHKGYDTKTVIEHQGSVGHDHVHVVTAAQLDGLSEQDLERILGGIRSKQLPEHVEDAEVITNEEE